MGPVLLFIVRFVTFLASAFAMSGYAEHAGAFLALADFLSVNAETVQTFGSLSLVALMAFQNPVVDLKKLIQKLFDKENVE